MLRSPQMEQLIQGTRVIRNNNEPDYNQAHDNYSREGEVSKHLSWSIFTRRNTCESMILADREIPMNKLHVGSLLADSCFFVKLIRASGDCLCESNKGRRYFKVVKTCRYNGTKRRRAGTGTCLSFGLLNKLDRVTPNRDSVNGFPRKPPFYSFSHKRRVCAPADTCTRPSLFLVFAFLHPVAHVFPPSNTTLVCT